MWILIIFPPAPFTIAFLVLESIVPSLYIFVIVDLFQIAVPSLLLEVSVACIVPPFSTVIVSMVPVPVS